MVTLTVLTKDPAPPGVQLQTAPIAPPTAGTQLVSTLQWNNLIDLLEGNSAEDFSSKNIIVEENFDLGLFDLLIRNPANTFDYTIKSGAITGARTATLPVLTANDVFVFEGVLQSLSLKTLITPTIASFINAGHDHLAAAGGGTITLAAVADVTMTVANLNSLDDGLDSTLHFHAADRARAVHTGTQDKSTITGLPWLKADIPAVTVFTDQANVFGNFDQTFKDNRILIESPDGLTPVTIVNLQQTLARTLSIPILTGNRSLVVTTEPSQIVIGTEVTGASTALTDTADIAYLNQANIFGAFLNSFAGSTMRIPLAAAPTMAVDGDFAIDTLITDFSMGLIKYFDGEEMAVISVPIAQLTTPTGGHVITYNAANDEFELVAAAGANHNLLSTTHPDTLAAAVSQGSIVLGNATPAWSELVIGAANNLLISNGTTLAYGLVADSNISVHTSTKITINAKGQLNADLLYTDEMTFKTSVRIATEVNDSLSGLAARDGITPVAGDRVLVKAQTAGEDNGIYVAASGAWTRSTDFDNDAKATSGSFIAVQEGTANADALFQLTTNEPITLGTTSLTFTQFAGGAGEANTISSLGGGTVLTAAVPKSGVDLRTVSIATTAPITHSVSADLLTFDINDIVDVDIGAHTSTKITITAKGQLNSAIVYNDQANVFGNFDQTFKDNRLRIENPAGTFEVQFLTSAELADRVLTIPLLGANRTMVVTGLANQIADAEIAAHTSTKITINAKGQLNSAIVYNDQTNVFGDFNQDFKDNRIRIFNPADTFAFTIIAPAIAAARNLTLPLLTGNDIIVTEAFAQPLTNKTIDGDLNTILDINETQQNVSVGASGTVLTSNGVGLAPTYQAASGGAPFVDTTSIVEGSADPGKEMRFEVDGFAAAIVRVMTVPDKDMTLAGTNDKLNAFAATTSAELRTVITDETGIGGLVFAIIPTLISPGIADFINATHSHLNAAGGGTITEASISDLQSYLLNVVEDTTPQLGGALDGQGNDLNNMGVLFLTEQADAEADVAGKGQVWVNLATPNELFFTDDVGTDFQVAFRQNKLDVFAATTKAELETVISDVADFAEADGDTYSGAHLFNSATMRIPLSATPTMAVDGDFAIDTTITDFSMGLIKYFDGEEMAVVSLPIAELTTPTGGHVITYNATNDEFELVAATGGEFTGAWTQDHNQGGSAFGLRDALFVDPTITTKKLQIDLAGMTAAVTAILDFNFTTAKTITFPDITGTVMLNLVEDTTPQLGGDLDAQSNDVNTLGNLLMTADETHLIDLTRDTAQGSNYTIGELRFRHDDGAGVLQNYAKIEGAMESDVGGLEDGSFRFSVTSAGVHDVLFMALNDGGAPVVKYLKNLDLNGNNLTDGGVIFLREQAEADADVAAQGQIWVDTATPNVLFFTDDAGTDHNLLAGGAAEPFAKETSSTDETVNNSTTIQADDELLVALSANTKYFIVFYVVWTGTSTADCKYDFTLPSGATGVRGVGAWTGGASAGMTSMTVVRNLAFATGDNYVAIPCIVEMGGTAGNVVLRWAQLNAEVSNLTREAGSTVVAWEED